MNFAITDAAPSTLEITNEQTTPCDGPSSPLGCSVTLPPRNEGEGSGVKCQLVFAIPSGDLEEAARLPDTAYRKLSRLLTCVASLHRVALAGGNLSEAFRIQADLYGHVRGFSPVSLERQYRRFLASGGNWRSLLDKAQAGAKYWNSNGPCGTHLPEKLILFFKRLAGENQRKTAPAWRELIFIWQHHTDSLGSRTYKPQDLGYDGGPSGTDWPPAHPGTGFPKGWSYENLSRALDDFELKAARIGRFAASQHRRKVFTTRVGLEIGQVQFFDDQWYDEKVNRITFAGQGGRAIRPLGYNALDFLSACSFHQAFKPTIVNADGSTQRLKQRTDFREFLASVVINVGFNPRRGTHFVVERGTAAISEELEQILFDLSGGKIVVDRAGVFSDPVIPSLFEESAKGNPRFKAPLESFFNLYRNYSALLPGQVGQDRDHSPAELAGRDLYNERLLKAAALLPPETAALLRLPFLEWNEWVRLSLGIYRAINNRKEHELEGWERAGFLVKEWRLPIPTQSGPDPWRPLADFQALALAQQKALAPIMQHQVRRASPWEVWTGQCGSHQGGSHPSCKDLQRLPIATIFKLLGPDFPVTERTVRDGYITVEDQEVSPDVLRFPAYPLGNGEKFRTYLLSGPAGELLALADARNRFVTALSRQNVPCRLDLAAVKAEMAAAKKEETERLTQLGIVHLDRAKQKAADHQHNAEVLRSADQLSRVKPKSDEDRELDKLFNAALKENIPSNSEPEQ
jgi:hypothetical protein